MRVIFYVLWSQRNFNVATPLLAVFFSICVHSHLVYSFTELKSCHQPFLCCWLHQERDPVTTRFTASLICSQCPPQALLVYALMAEDMSVSSSFFS